MHHNSPDDELVVLGDLYWGELFVLGLQPDGGNQPLVLFKMYPLEGELAVYEAYGNGPLSWFKGLVYDEEVAVKDAGPLHGGTPCPSKESAGRVLYKFPVEVYTVFYIILGRRGEAGFYLR